MSEQAKKSSTQNQQPNEFLLDSTSGEDLGGDDQQSAAGSVGSTFTSSLQGSAAALTSARHSLADGAGNAPAGQGPPPNQTSENPSALYVQVQAAGANAALGDHGNAQPLTFAQVQGSSHLDQHNSQAQPLAYPQVQGSGHMDQPHFELRQHHEPRVAARGDDQTSGRHALMVSEQEYAYIRMWVKKDRDASARGSQAQAHGDDTSDTILLDSPSHVPQPSSSNAFSQSSTAFRVLAQEEIITITDSPARRAPTENSVLSNSTPAARQQAQGAAQQQSSSASSESEHQAPHSPRVATSKRSKLPAEANNNPVLGFDPRRRVGGGHGQQLHEPTRSPAQVPGQVAQGRQQQPGQQADPSAQTRLAPATPKRPAAALPWECPNCGSKEADHDAVLCTAPRRTDMTRSQDAYRWLQKLDNLRRDQRLLHRKSAAEANESEHGEEIHSDSEASAEEEGEDETQNSSILDDTSSYQPSSSSSSSVPSANSNPRDDAGTSAVDARLDRMESLLQSFLEGRQRSETSSAARERDVRFSESPVHVFGGSASSARGNSQLSGGMLGCPELEKREDLLIMSKFEALEKKYADYVDRAQDHDRNPQTMAHCFRKYLPMIVMTLNSLLSRDAAVRRKYKDLLNASSYTVDEDQLKSWDARTFASMYKELCTAKTYMASEVITQLMDTKFARHPPRGQDPYTLTMFVMQASTAFQEKLDAMPTQTVKRCSDSQLRDTFVKMILGKEDRHLADFSHCYNWSEAASAMFDLEGTGQGVNFMRQALEGHLPDSARDRAGGGDGQRQQDRSGNRSADRPTERAADRSQDRQSQGGGQAKDAPQDWTRILRRLSAEIDHSPSDLEGHHTDKEKAKRLLSLRDARRRQDELRDLERAASGKQDTRPRHPSRDSVAEPRGPPSRDHSRDSARESGVSTSKTAQHPTQSQLGPATGETGPRCYNCRGFGHLAKDCPKIGAGSGGGVARSRDSSTASRGKNGNA